jgi:hypothetical protein
MMKLNQKINYKISLLYHKFNNLLMAIMQKIHFTINAKNNG